MSIIVLGFPVEEQQGCRRSLGGGEGQTALFECVHIAGAILNQQGKKYHPNNTVSRVGCHVGSMTRMVVPMIPFVQIFFRYKDSGAS